MLRKSSRKSSSSESESYSEEEENESSSESSSSDVENNDNKVVNHNTIKKPETEIPYANQRNLDLLLALDSTDTAPVMEPANNFFVANVQENEQNDNTIKSVQPKYMNTSPIELLNRINGRGLSITYRFTRLGHIFSSSMICFNLIFTNHTNQEINDVRLGKKVINHKAGFFYRFSYRFFMCFLLDRVR